MSLPTAFASRLHRATAGRSYPVMTRAFVAAAAVLFLALAGCGGSAQTDGVTVPASTPASTPDSPPASTAPGSATLSWSGPTTNVDGSPLTSLAGYRVYYGTVPGEYTRIDVGNTTSYQFHDLTPGTTYYFAVTAVDQYGDESDYSAVVSKVIS